MLPKLITRNGKVFEVAHKPVDGKFYEPGGRIVIQEEGQKRYFWISGAYHNKPEAPIRKTLLVGMFSGEANKQETNLIRSILAEALEGESLWPQE